MCDALIEYACSERFLGMECEVGVIVYDTYGSRRVQVGVSECVRESRRVAVS